MDFFAFIESVGFCLLPTLGKFQPLFHPIVFQTHSLSSPSGTPTTWMLELLLLSHRTLRFCLFFIFFQSIFSLLYFLLINLHLLFLCHFHPVIEPIQWVLKFGYCIFQLQNFHLIAPYIFYFFSKTIFLFVPKMFIIAYLNMFMMAALKSFQIIPTSMSFQYCWLLIVFSHSSFDFSDSWYYYFLLYLGHLRYYETLNLI